MKYSKQRELIEKAVKGNHIHPTADDIYVRLKPDNPNLSLGTVYRNLNLLAQNSVINKIAMPNGSDRFDGNLHKHYHVICEDCGEIFDVQLDLPKEFDEKIQVEAGVVVSAYQLIISGLCEKCRKA